MEFLTNWLHALVASASKLDDAGHRRRAILYVAAGLLVVGVLAFVLRHNAGIGADPMNPNSGWEAKTVAMVIFGKIVAFPVLSIAAVVFSIFEYKAASMVLPQLRRQGIDATKTDSYTANAEIYKAIILLALALGNFILAAAVL